MAKQIKDFFNSIKQGKNELIYLETLTESLSIARPILISFTYFWTIDNEDMVDLTELKHYLHKANIHRTNPALFKRINDIAL